MSQGEAYLSDFSVVLLFIIAGTIFVLVSLLVARLIRPNRPNPEKLSSYESGEDPVGVPWTQFNIRFYIIALVFLLFEVEIIFLFPWSTVFADKELAAETGGAWPWFALLEMIVFIGVLALGLAYAWVNGHLNWITPDPKPTPFKSNVPREMYDRINEHYKHRKK
jgi:NADH-quinone oxidoreductase subunit A